MSFKAVSDLDEGTGWIKPAAQEMHTHTTGHLDT